MTILNRIQVAPSATLRLFGVDQNSSRSWRKHSLAVRRTPLHLAASCGNISVINRLVAFGANVEADNTRGWRTLHYAFYHGSPLAFRTFLDHGALIMDPELFPDSTRRRYICFKGVPKEKKEHCISMLGWAMDAQGVERAQR